MRDVEDLQLPTATVIGPDIILDTRVYKKTRTREYKEHLIKRHGQNDADAIWIKELEFKKMGVDPTIINPRVD